MAFTGTAVKSDGTYTVRITGLTLAASASGTITASGGAGDVTLPSTFPTFDADNFIVQINQIAAGATTPIVVTKDSPFTTITIANSDAINDTGGLEIFIRHVHTVVQ